jgi:hypothetical protein
VSDVTPSLDGLVAWGGLRGDTACSDGVQRGECEAGSREGSVDADRLGYRAPGHGESEMSSNNHGEISVFTELGSENDRSELWCAEDGEEPVLLEDQGEVVHHDKLIGPGLVSPLSNPLTRTMEPVNELNDSSVAAVLRADDTARNPCGVCVTEECRYGMTETPSSLGKGAPPPLMTDSMLHDELSPNLEEGFRESERVEGMMSVSPALMQRAPSTNTDEGDAGEVLELRALPSDVEKSVLRVYPCDAPTLGEAPPPALIRSLGNARLVGDAPEWSKRRRRRLGGHGLSCTLSATLLQARGFVEARLLEEGWLERCGDLAAGAKTRLWSGYQPGL